MCDSHSFFPNEHLSMYLYLACSLVVTSRVWLGDSSVVKPSNSLGTLNHNMVYNTPLLASHTIPVHSNSSHICQYQVGSSLERPKVHRWGFSPLNNTTEYWSCSFFCLVKFWHFTLTRGIYICWCSWYCWINHSTKRNEGMPCSCHPSASLVWQHRCDTTVLVWCDNKRLL